MNVMNTDSMPGIVRLGEKELQELTKEVKETIAFKAVPKKTKKNFTAAQMWNMKRRMRSATLQVPVIRVIE
jgi:hypothetical protein